MLKHKHIIDQMSLEEKVAFCSGADFWRTKQFEQLGIPSIMLTDGPHGLRKQSADAGQFGINQSVPATAFPTASASACSWDRDLLRAMGKALGLECRQHGVSVLLGPGVNIQRNPLCGRNFEYFSEDPLLAGELGAAWVQGLESQGVGAAVKHFAGNNQESVRMSSNSLIDERALREIYLPAFERVVTKGRPSTLMCAYNQINGSYCSDNSWLLRTVLRQEWGFSGVVMTDWGAMNDRPAAFRAGLELEMPGGVGVHDQQVLEEVQAGRLSEDLIDVAVDRLLHVVLRLAVQPATAFDPELHHQLARSIAAQSAVLLKNDDGLLPLRSGQKLVVVGEMARNPRYQGSGSSMINPTRLSSALDGLDQAGVSYQYFPLLTGQSREALRGADLVLVFAGLTDAYESEGFDRTTMALPDEHNAMIIQAAQSNPNTVVVLAGGAPVELPWLGQVKAVLHMMLAGQAGGLAVADLLTGTVNPSGKLSVSYPLRYADLPSAGFYETGGKQAEYRESVYLGYRYYDKVDQAVAFPFGHGLSYTSFEYSPLNLSAREISANAELTVSVTIRNSGQVAGAEIVQLYLAAPDGPFYRPSKELREFGKVFLQPGELKNLEFRLRYRDFSCWSPVEHGWVAAPGNYRVIAAASSRDLRAEATVQVIGRKIEPQKGTVAAWYLRPQGPVTSADFSTILGYLPVPPPTPKKGEYHLGHTMVDMEKSLIIRWMRKIVAHTIAKDMGPGCKKTVLYKMMLQTAYNTPFRSMVAMGNGAFPMNQAQGMVSLANGKWFKGIAYLLNMVPKSK